MSETILEMRGITKTFPGVKALSDVNLNVREAEIHAIVGENGAGKSTLMKVLSGVYPSGSYEGEILYKGEEQHFKSISDSEHKGIVIIHQELALVPLLSIAENIFLGNEQAKGGVIDWDETRDGARKLLRMVGLSEDPNTLVTNIGVGKQQLVEIAKALSKEVKLLILDEPTASLSEKDSAALLDLLRECAEADGGIFGEARDRRELVYRPRESLYNQPPKLVLSYANKQLAPPFEPVEDDQVRNKWEVSRDGGSSGYAMLEEGDLSVQDPPDGIGEYPDSATLNLYSDAQTEPIAGWLLHLTTWDEARYPQVTVRLHRHPELIRDVLALDVGDKIRIEGLPVRFASGSAVELLIDGWTETFRPRTWEITFNCSPAGPWTVGAVGIYEDFSDTDYAVTITDGGNLPWARSQLHYQSASWSLRSGAITNNQTSDAIVTVPDGATALSF